MKQSKAIGILFRIEESNQQIESEFDLEAWLADLLVDYWLSREPKAEPKLASNKDVTR